jgi:hypothetical protein
LFLNGKWALLSFSLSKLKLITKRKKSIVKLSKLYKIRINKDLKVFQMKASNKINIEIISNKIITTFLKVVLILGNHGKQIQLSFSRILAYVQYLSLLGITMWRRKRPASRILKKV